MNICVFGDSIAWGASDYEKGGWVERLKSYYMENDDDVGVYNLGISGESTDGLLKRFESEAAMRETDLVIFATGINDSKSVLKKGNHPVNLDGFKENISRLTKMARKIKNNVIFVGLTRVDESKTNPISWNTEKYYDNNSIEKYDEVIRKFCEREKLKYVSVKEIVGISDLEDGLHPDSLGHEKLFKAVKNATDEFLQAAGIR